MVKLFIFWKNCYHDHMLTFQYQRLTKRNTIYRHTAIFISSTYPCQRRQRGARCHSGNISMSAGRSLRNCGASAGRVQDSSPLQISTKINCTLKKLAKLKIQTLIIHLCVCVKSFLLYTSFQDRFTNHQILYGNKRIESYEEKIIYSWRVDRIVKKGP